MYEQNLELMKKTVKSEIRRLKRTGVVGMSYANFRQIVPTKGLTIPPSAFDRLLLEAIGGDKFIGE